MEHFELILFHPFQHILFPKVVLSKGLEKDVIKWYESLPKDPEGNTIPLLVKLTKDQYDLILSHMTDIVVLNNLEE
jgi:hypothetical protein